MEHLLFSGYILVYPFVYHYTAVECAIWSAAKYDKEFRSEIKSVFWSHPIGVIHSDTEHISDFDILRLDAFGFFKTF